MRKSSTQKNPKTVKPLSQAALTKIVGEFVEKQQVLIEKLDQFVMRVMAHEERLKRLEESLLTHLECATWVKATIRFWPVIVGAFLFLFGISLY